MDSIYYILIILGISFGLIVLYIILRSMKVIGAIPILSDIVDPILNRQLGGSSNRMGYYYLKGNSATVKEWAMNPKWIVHEELRTGNTSKNYKQYVGDHVVSKELEKTGSMSIHSVDIDQQAFLDNTPDNWAKRLNFSAAVQTVVEDGEVLHIRLHRSPVKDRFTSDHSKGIPIGSELYWKDNSGIHGVVIKPDGTKTRHTDNSRYPSIHSIARKMNRSKSVGYNGSTIGRSEKDYDYFPGHQPSADKRHMDEYFEDNPHRKAIIREMLEKETKSKVK